MHLIDTRRRGADARALTHTPRSSEAAIRQLADRDLEQLRRALGCALCELTVGSPPSQLVGRLSRLARAEQRRRERQHARGPQAA